jgi:hypothetical protein
MQHSMFNAANVLIHRHPVFGHFPGKRFLLIFGIAVPQIVPGRTDKCIHGVRFPPGRFTADRTGDIDEAFHFGQWGSTFCAKLHIDGKYNGQIFFRHRNSTAIITVNNGNGCTPVALPGNQPVPQPVVDLQSRRFHLHQNPCRSLGFRLPWTKPSYLPELTIVPVPS